MTIICKPSGEDRIWPRKSECSVTNVIITGDSQSGKTTWCAGYAAQMKADGKRIGGILCPQSRINGVKIGYDVIDLMSGEQTGLGRYISRANFDGPLNGAFRLSNAGLEFSRQAIEKAISLECSTIFIDEVGQLDLKRCGFIETSLPAYTNGSETITVIRKYMLVSFLEYFQDNFPDIRFKVKSVW